MAHSFLFPRGSIYLSGGMQHAVDLGAGWRKEASLVLQGMGYHPIDITELDRKYAELHGNLYFLENKENHLQFKSNIRQHFIHADLELVIKHSDALIVYYDESVRRGAGTTSEAQVAYNHDIPVFLVSAYEDWVNEVPGWLQGLTTKIFTRFVDLYKYMGHLPAGILKRDMYGNHGVNSQYLCSLCGEVFKKSKHHFVSKVSPTYCSSCVEVISETHEGHPDRFQFMMNVLGE